MSMQQEQIPVSISKRAEQGVGSAQQILCSTTLKDFGLDTRASLILSVNQSIG